MIQLATTRFARCLVGAFLIAAAIAAAPRCADAHGIAGNRFFPGTLALEFSTLYLTNRFTPGKLPKEEPLNQFVPLIEFSFDSPRGQKTAATMNPGLSYVAVSWQVAAEAIVPLNSEAGRSIGVRAQLLLFLQDLIPSVFGKPLLGD